MEQPHEAARDQQGERDSRRIGAQRSGALRIGRGLLLGLGWAISVAHRADRSRGLGEGQALAPKRRRALAQAQGIAQNVPLFAAMQIAQAAGPT